MVLQNVEDVIGGYAGASRTVLDYSLAIKRLVGEAKEPGFSIDSWNPLTELVAVAEFERVGPFKDVMNWPDYMDFLTNWARSSEWECSFKRITETAGLVFLELEERSAVGDFTSVVNSLSVYEFDAAWKIRRIDVYLQMELPNSNMTKSVDGA